MTPSSKKPRPSEAERDYSHRSLLDKLGVKSGQRILILEILDASFLNEIKLFAPIFAESKPAADFDLVFLAVEVKEDLKQLPRLRKFIKKHGAIWVVYPKGKQHVREIEVINAGKDAALTDNKVCSFSATHIALRFVIPLAQR
jgi:hypothetical protein